MSHRPCSPLVRRRLRAGACLPLGSRRHRCQRAIILPRHLRRISIDDLRFLIEHAACPPALALEILLFAAEVERRSR
ncbi:MAG: hypothetical protein C4306_03330 [Thermoleophilia bacterium]